jgi:hypothetical protein
MSRSFARKKKNDQPALEILMRLASVPALLPAANVEVSGGSPAEEDQSILNYATDVGNSAVGIFL